ncbi:LWXIA domain-containing protein [Ralstonia mojiangensis]|uniref:LWXIA domain-containing protein n=1 Tax=Ralstonia mojiangensis TaxID=2953895 RepID=UPI0020900503|nr:LWXIA domain-containing protein [Ralstonia mojiangensis]MCO5413536.1 LWXIA domain-containing protein [Ralstonia mojiangensis]
MLRAIDGGGGVPTPPQPIQPPPPPSARDVSDAETALKNALQGKAPDDTAALKAAIEKIQQTQPSVSRDALARAAILLQAAHNKSAPATPQPKVDSLKQAASQVGLTHVFDNTTLDSATQSLSDKPLATDQAPPMQAVTLQDARAAIQAGLDGGMTEAEAVNAARAQLGGSEQNETVLSEAALTIAAEKAVADGKVPADADPIQNAAKQDVWLGIFSKPTIDNVVKALHVELKPAANLDDTVKATQTAFETWQKDKAANADAATLARDKQAYHTALSDELNAAAGQPDSQWRADPLQTDRRLLAERLVAQRNSAASGTQGPPPTASVLNDLHAAEIVDAAQAARASGGADGNLKAAQALTQQLRGVANTDPLYASVMDDARTQDIQSGALQDITHASGKNPHDTLVAEGNALSRYKDTVLYKDLVNSALNAGITHDNITKVGTPGELRDIAALLEDVQRASPELAQALYTQNLQGKIDSKIKAGDPEVYAPSMQTLDKRDDYYGPISRIVNALGGPKSDGAAHVMGSLRSFLYNAQADQDRYKENGYTPPSTPFDTLGLAKANNASMAPYQTIIDEDPNGALSKTLQKHTGLKPSPPTVPVGPDDAAHLSKAQAALNKALGSGTADAAGLQKALDAARNDKANADISNQTWAQAAVLARAQAVTVARQQDNTGDKTGDKAGQPQTPSDPIDQATKDVDGDQLFTEQDLQDGVNALRTGNVAATPDAKTPDTQRDGAQPDTTAHLGQLVASGMTMPEAIAATRAWLGGNEQNEAMLTQSALTVAAQQHLEDYYQDPTKDPVDAGAQDLAKLNVLDPDVLRVTAGIMKQDIQPDQKALDGAVTQARTDYAAWQDAKAKSDKAPDNADLKAAAARALQSYHNDLDQALNVAAGHKPEDGDWQLNPDNVDTLWKAQNAVTMSGIAPEMEAARGTGKDSPEFKQLLTSFQQWQTGLGAQQVLHIAAHALQANGGPGKGDAAAAKRLTGLLAGMQSGDPLFDQVMGDASISGLQQRALQSILDHAPMMCTAANDGKDSPQGRLSAMGTSLDVYKGTIFYAQLLDDTIQAPQTQSLFQQSGAQVFGKGKKDQANAAADQMNGVAPDLAAALYHSQFQGKLDVTDLKAMSRIYAAAGGARNQDMTDLRKQIEGLMLKPLDNGGLGTESVDSRLNTTYFVGGDGMAVVTGQDFGLKDVKDDNVPMQLTQDILGDNIGDDVSKEIRRETGFKDSPKPPTPANADPNASPPLKNDLHWSPDTAGVSSGTTAGVTASGNTVGLPWQDGMHTVTSQAQVYNAVGQAYGLDPTYTARSLDEQQAMADGQFAEYSGNEVVYDHKGHKTTLAQVASQLMHGEGVNTPSGATPVALTSLSMQWWDNREGKGDAKRLAIMEGIGTDGRYIDVGPADTTVRNGYGDWQSHSGLDRGLLIAQPHWVVDANGNLMTDDGYWKTYKPDDHWYNWEHLKTDLEIGLTVAAGIITTVVQPETAALWAVVLSNLADAYFAVTAVAGAAHSINALSTAKGRDDPWNWVGLGANVLGGAAGVGGLVNRTAVAAARVGAYNADFMEAINAVRITRGASAEDAARISLLNDNRWALRPFQNNLTNAVLSHALYGSPAATANAAQRLNAVFGVTRNPGVVADLTQGTLRLQRLNEAIPLLNRADVLARLPARLRRLAGLRFLGGGALAYRLMGTGALNTNLAAMLHQGQSLATSNGQATGEDWVQFFTSAGLMGAGMGVARQHGASQRQAYEAAAANLAASGMRMPGVAPDPGSTPVQRVVPELGPRGAESALESQQALLARVQTDGAQGALNNNQVYRLYSRTGGVTGPEDTMPGEFYFPRLIALAEQRPEGAYAMSQDGAYIDSTMPTDGRARTTFYHFMREDGRVDPDAVTERVYVNAKTQHVLDVLDFLVRGVVDQPGRFPGIYAAKASGPDAAGPRADNIVVYATDRAAVDRVVEALRHYQQQHPEHFHDTVPSMTEAQLRGVSTAAEPTPAMVDRLLSAIDRFAAGNTQFGATDIGRTPSPEQSFGGIRAYAISLAQHDTVLAQQAAAQYGVPFDYSAALQKATSRRFAEIGIDPANPARNLGGPVSRPAGSPDYSGTGTQYGPHDGTYQTTPADRVTMSFGGAPLPPSAHALIGASDTLARQLRLLHDAGWTVRLGHSNRGSAVDTERKTITLDANAPDAGALVYTLSHEADHAVKAELDLQGLQHHSEGSFVQTLLAGEASAQGNAFNVRDEVLAATGVDIGARAQMPQPLEQAYAQWDANNPEAYLRLAQTMASMRTSVAPDQTYVQYYASHWNGGAPGTPHMPAPATASGAQKAAQAAEWLDVKDLRSLRHVPGAEVPRLSDLANKAGSNTVLIALKGTSQPDGTPVIIATTQLRDDGTFAPPQAVRGSNVPKIVKRAVRGDNSAMHTARKGVDFYISPVSYERLQAFGGPSRINGDDGSHVLSPAADKIDTEVVDHIQQLGGAKRYKSVQEATSAAKDDNIIYVIDKKGGAPKGHAKRGTDGTWTYHVDAPMDGATVPERSLEAAFAKQQTRGARTLRSAPRGVRFVVSSVQPETVKELGGFLEPRTLWKRAEYGMPAFKPGEIAQATTTLNRQANGGFLRGRAAQLLQWRQRTLEEPVTTGTPLEASALGYANARMLPDTDAHALDYSGPNIVHLRDLVKQGWLEAGTHYIYVYKTADNAGELGAHTPTGRLEPDGNALTWYGAWNKAAAQQNGTPAKELAVGHDSFGADTHFLLTRLPPDQFEAWQRSGTGLDIGVYQPVLSSTTTVALPPDAPKLGNLTRPLDEVELLAGKKDDPYASNVEFKSVKDHAPEVVMADAQLWRKIKLKLRVARDVAANTVSRRVPFAGKRIAQRYSAAATGDRHMVNTFLRSEFPLQARLAPMGRAYRLRDDPAKALAFIKKTGGAMPVISLVVDPYSLRAAVGKRQDPSFVRAAKQIDESNATIDHRNAQIKSGKGADTKKLFLDDLHQSHLDKWLDLSVTTGVVIRFEFAPSRPHIGPNDHFTARTNDAYDNHVRLFSMLEKWGATHPDASAPHVMVSFHGWDTVLEPVPGGGNAKLVEQVLERPTLPWVHMGLSYATNGTDAIANERLNTAVADMVLRFEQDGAPTQGRLHGDDALTRVFERPSKSQYDAQNQVLLAEIARLGKQKYNLSDSDVNAIIDRVFNGNTSALVNRARATEIDFAKPLWEAKRRLGPTEKRANQFADQWTTEMGVAARPAGTKALPASASNPATPLDPWKDMVKADALSVDNSGELQSAGRVETTQTAQKGLAAPRQASAELNALGVAGAKPEGGASVREKAIVGASVVGGMGAVLIGIPGTGADTISLASNPSMLLLRVGRSAQVLHQATMATIERADPRVFSEATQTMVDRLVKALPNHKEKTEPDDLAKIEDRLRTFVAEANWSVHNIYQRLGNREITRTQSSEATQAVSADLVKQIQAIFSGTGLQQVHLGHPRTKLGYWGRQIAIGGYSMGLASYAHAMATKAWTLAHDSAIWYVLPTGGTVASIAYTTGVLLGRGRNIDIEQRSRTVRGLDISADTLAATGGMLLGAAQMVGGDYVKGVPMVLSSGALGLSRFSSHFPNASAFVSKHKIAIALVPLSGFAFNLIKPLFMQDDKNKRPPGTSAVTPSPSASPSASASPSGSPSPSVSPSASLSPSTSPSTSTSPTAPSTSQPPSTPATPQPTPTHSEYVVQSGDTLNGIADRYRTPLLHEAHVSDAQRQAMSDEQQVEAALAQLLQINPQFAHRNVGLIHPDEPIVIVP